MEDLIRMLTCPCRDGAGKVSCRCHELAPKFRCGCASCISQRLARLEDMDCPFDQCKHEQDVSDTEPLQVGLVKMLGVPATAKFVCILRHGHEGKHAVVPISK